MRFPFQELHNLADARQNFEFLQTRFPARGVATINFPNSTSATVMNVNHGLGAIPTSVVVSPQFFSTGAMVAVYVGGFTKVKFTLNASSDSVINGDVGVCWIAML